MVEPVHIHALLFELADRPGCYLIAWPNETGHGKWCWHVHPEKTLFDVEPGHRIVHKRRTLTVNRVKPYRTSECKHERDYPWVTSGRAYLEAGGMSVIENLAIDGQRDQPSTIEFVSEKECSTPDGVNESFTRKT